MLWYDDTIMTIQNTLSGIITLRFDNHLTEMESEIKAKEICDLYGLSINHIFGFSNLITVDAGKTWRINDENIRALEKVIKGQSQRFNLQLVELNKLEKIGPRS